MFYLLSLFTGMIISIMVASNGGLTSQYGLYSATVLIHVIGLIAITILVFINKDKILHKRQAWYLYTPGLIGVFTVVFTNFAFFRISVSSIMALGLLGQCVAGIIIDHYGLMKMPKCPFVKQKLIGIIFIVLGIASMINSFEVVAVIFAFSTGITVIVARTLNANLAEATSIQTSTFYNYIMGLLGAIIALLLLGRGELHYIQVDFVVSTGNWFFYIGGILGLISVSISNFVVKKVSAFYFTLLLFIGQIVAGLIIDVVLTGKFNIFSVIGGILVTLGLSIDLVLEKRRKINKIRK